MTKGRPAHVSCRQAAATERMQRVKSRPFLSSTFIDYLSFFLPWEKRKGKKEKTLLFRKVFSCDLRKKKKPYFA